jgi:hypothetical protein
MRKGARRADGPRQRRKRLRGVRGPLGKTLMRRTKAGSVVAYMRTSSAANVGADKDSEKRQRAAIEAFAKRSGADVLAWFFNPAVLPTRLPRQKSLRFLR